MLVLFIAFYFLREDRKSEALPTPLVWLLPRPLSGKPGWTCRRGISSEGLDLAWDTRYPEQMVRPEEEL